MMWQLPESCLSASRSEVQLGLARRHAPTCAACVRGSVSMCAPATPARAALGVRIPLGSHAAMQRTTRDKEQRGRDGRETRDGTGGVWGVGGWAGRERHLPHLVLWSVALERPAADEHDFGSACPCGVPVQPCECARAQRCVRVRADGEGTQCARVSPSVIPSHLSAIQKPVSDGALLYAPTVACASSSVALCIACTIAASCLRLLTHVIPRVPPPARQARPVPPLSCPRLTTTEQSRMAVLRKSIEWAE